MEKLLLIYKKFSMKKLLLKAAAATALFLAPAASAMAETTAYGFVFSASFGQSLVSFDYSALSSSATVSTTQLAEISELEDLDEGIMGGASVEDGYIALYRQSFSTVLCSYNMETGAINTLHKYSVSNGMPAPGMSLTSVAYDKTAKKLYGLENTYDEDDNDFLTVYEIDLSSFELTQVANYPITELTYNGFLVDDGKFYFVKEDQVNFKFIPKLYTVGDDNKLKLLVNNLMLEVDNVYTHSAAFDPDGNVVYTAGKKVVKFDLGTKAVSSLGEINKMIAGLTFTKSTKDIDGNGSGQQGGIVRNVVSIKSLGSYMGDAPDSVDTRETKYFYDSHNQLICMVEYARTYTSVPGQMGDYEISYIHRYEFDDQGRRIAKKKLQYGMYDYGDFAFKESAAGAESYEYDENGRMSKKVESFYTYLYEYDEDGNLVKEERLLTSTGETSITITNFYNDGELYATVSSCPKYPQSTSDNYATVFFFEDGLKVGAYTKYLGTANDLNNIMFGDMDIMEEWEYFDKGDVKLYTQYQVRDDDGQPLEEPKAVRRTEGSYVNGDTNQHRVVSYNWDTIAKGWVRSGLPQVSCYQEFDPEVAQFVTLDLQATLDDSKLNTPILSWNLPQIFFSSPGKFNIYRDGILLAEVDMMDVINMETLACEYVDEQVQNGNHQYFVQPLVASGSDIDDDVVYTPYNASNIVILDMNTELPAVTDLKAVNKTSREEGGVDPESGNTQTEEVITVNLTWTNPEDVAPYGFISNGIYIDNNQLAECLVDNDTVTTGSYIPYNDKHTVFVITRYRLGKAFSDKIEVKDADLPMLSAIASIAADGVKVALCGKVVETSEAAHIVAFSMAGAKVAEVAASTTLDLSGSAPGAYIICVEKAGKVTTFKAVIK